MTEEQRQDEREESAALAAMPQLLDTLTRVCMWRTDNGDNLMPLVADVVDWTAREGSDNWDGRATGSQPEEVAHMLVQAIGVAAVWPKGAKYNHAERYWVNPRDTTEVVAQDISEGSDLAERVLA